MVTKHEAYELFFGDKGAPAERHMWSTVSQVNSDGTVMVPFNESTTMKCTTLAQVSAGDRVLVLRIGRDAVVLGKVMQ